MQYHTFKTLSDLTTLSEFCLSVETEYTELARLAIDSMHTSGIVFSDSKLSYFDELSITTNYIVKSSQVLYLIILCYISGQ